MPPKKKKTAAKNVNRGFATTSIPKKVVASEPAPEEPAAPAPGDPKASTSESTTNGSSTPATAVGDAKASEGQEEWDAEQQEERELQALAERIRPACEKEIAKQMKVIDFENRLSKTLPKFAWHDQRFQDEILQLALDSEADSVRPVAASESEEKALQQVVILYGILQKLEFRTDRIAECLRAIRDLDLDEAMDWLLLHCSVEELSARGAASDVQTSGEQTGVATPAEPSSDPSTVPTPSRLPSAMKGTRAATASDVDELTADLKRRILAFDEDPASSRPSEDASTTEYVSLKLELAELAKKIPSGTALKGKALKDAAKARKDHKAVEDKIKLLQATYNFDQKLADEALRAKLAEHEAAPSLTPAEPTMASDDSTPIDSEGSSAVASPSLDPVDASSVPLSPVLEVSDPPQRLQEVAESDDEGGMFGDLLDEMPKQEVADNNTIVIVRDMPLPRHFSGKTPRSLLEDAIRRQDKFAQTRYLVISRSRAIRASVDIRWQGGKVDTYSMEDEACYDDIQAYNYVATVALFKLAPGPSNRLLPPGFRELWEELEVKRKVHDDRGYTEHLRDLMRIVKDRASSSAAQPGRAGRTVTASSNAAENGTNHRSFPDVPAQTLQQDFFARQQWPSYQEMLLQRNTLPIAAYRSALVEAIQSNQVIVLCGETGCGKSTQLPAFLLENELQNGRPVKIYCTEPRRISAISLANRVSQELGEAPGTVGQRGSLVGYNIRLEAKASASTRLIYATTGIVLRMLEGGNDLDDMTHLIIDEVHERSIDSDFLLIALKTILERRPELRVVLMSATVDAEKLSIYMKGAPVLQVPGRTFPVSSYFLEDAIEQSGYSLDPSSDSPYLTRFNKKHPPRIRTEEDAPQLDDEDDQMSGGAALSTVYSKRTRTTLDVLDENAINFDLLLMLLEKICIHDQHLVQNFSHAILIFLPSLETIRKAVEMLESHPLFGSNAFQIFPLHSTVSNENQSLVFNRPPMGVRKIVVSTNIAETGVTIPDVTCCIDSGKHKEMRYDEKRQISRLIETFIARSNATQRRGRAGRVQEGICYHLFTRSRMENAMAEEPLPEMLRLSLQDLALRIKIMRLGDSIEDTLLKALDPPSVTNIARAIQSLVEVKALTASQEITPLGRHLVKLPMDVHMGKLLILGCMFGCLSPALTVAAALNSKSPFVTPFGREREADVVKRSFKVDNSDFLTICKVYELWRNEVRNGTHFSFCRKNFLSHQNFSQIEELRLQFYSLLVDGGFVSGAAGASAGRGRLRFCSVPPAFDVNAVDHKVVMACIAGSMFPKLLIRDSTRQWRTFTNNAPASVHPTSVNFTPGRRPDFGDADYVTYFNIMQSKKLYVWESGGVDERAVLMLCGEADFKLPALSLSIDRKIRVAIGPKAAIALRLLRTHFQQVFNQRMRNPSKPLTAEQQRWFDLVIEAVAESREVRRQLLPSKKDSEPERPLMKVTLAPAPASITDDSTSAVPQE